ncbi:MAG: hypothetical protein QGF00_30570, partial [Planctomycetota bacterium]|nr:hypothetical protein [Planctomycetota bacterium]
MKGSPAEERTSTNLLVKTVKTGGFTDFRGNAPPVCLAQPGGLGSNEAQSKGQRPDHLHDWPAANG